tara:strand:- start:255 stop:518 length:264 start_codon:yes stop_codon:yes gene_type:complete
MKKFNDDLGVPLLSPTERTAITFDYISTFITKMEKLEDGELLAMEGKILYYLNWVEGTDKVIASFLRNVVKYSQDLRHDRHVLENEE